MSNQIHSLNSLWPQSFGGNLLENNTWGELINYLNPILEKNSSQESLPFLSDSQYLDMVNTAHQGNGISGAREFFNPIFSHILGGVNIKLFTALMQLQGLNEKTKLRLVVEYLVKLIFRLAKDETIVRSSHLLTNQDFGARSRVLYFIAVQLYLYFFAQISPGNNNVQTSDSHLMTLLNNTKQSSTSISTASGVQNELMQTFQPDNQQLIINNLSNGQDGEALALLIVSIAKQIISSVPEA